MCHLLGSSRIINSIREVAANGGLGEAAAWLVLRQSIYVSLTTNAPLNVNLECYKPSLAFLGLTDHAWANKIVFIFAETLVFSAGFEGDIPVQDQEWQSLQQAAMEWYRDKPSTFLPVFESSVQSPTSTSQNFQSTFPEISMLEAPHVMGQVYYHLTLIILALTMPSKGPRRRGFQAVQAWHETETTIRQNLRRVIGLAMSNSHAVAANFEASHILYACGHCITSPAERDAAIRFLGGVREKLGWSIDHIISHLERHWSGEC